MLTNVAETSVESFYSTPPSTLQRREAEIMALFGPTTKLSRNQISEMIKRPISGVCGRANSLVAKGDLIEEGHRRDAATGKRQKLLRLPTGQVELF